VIPGEQRPAVTVSVVDHKSGPMIVDCLGSLFRSTSLPLEVFVVQNLPGDTVSLTATFPQVTTIRNSVPLGFSANHNQAIALGVAPYHLVLNDDTIIPEGVLDGLVAFADAHPRAGIIAPELVDLAGEVVPCERPARFPTLLSEVSRSIPPRWLPDGFRGYYPASVRSQPFQPDWVSGACLLLRRTALRDSGPLDAGYFLYYEEPDLCHRMRRAGWEVWYVPDVQVVHLSGQTVKRHMPREWNQTQFYFSRVRYFRQHHGLVTATLMRAGVLFVDAWRWMKWLVMWRFSRSDESYVRLRLATAALRRAIDMRT